MKLLTNTLCFGDKSDIIGETVVFDDKRKNEIIAKVFDFTNKRNIFGKLLNSKWHYILFINLAEIYFRNKYDIIIANMRSKEHNIYLFSALLFSMEFYII